MDLGRDPRGVVRGEAGRRMEPCRQDAAQDPGGQAGVITGDAEGHRRVPPCVLVELDDLDAGGAVPVRHEDHSPGRSSALYMMCSPTLPRRGWSNAFGTVARTVKPSDCHRPTAGFVSTTALKTIAW